MHKPLKSELSEPGDFNVDLSRPGLYSDPAQDDGILMTIETWEPAKSSSLTLERLQELLSQIGGLEENELAASLNDEFIRSNSQLMKLDAISWQVAEQLMEDDLVTLVRFFTLAEMQLSGWEAGNRNPVIPLVRILKQRDQFLPELRKWIKANTDNRYLPYGAAL